MVGIALTASATTGANLSDTKSGVITGQVASVSVTGSGGGNETSGGSANLDISFANLLVPGVPQTVTTNFSNSGNINEDIYLVFSNSHALHAINQLGTFGTVVIREDGHQIFASANLQDGLQTGGGGPFFGCNDVVCPIPAVIPLATNVQPTVLNSWTFTFGYATKFSTVISHNFNAYPVTAAGLVDANSTSSGLPYSFVAVPAGAAAPVIAPAT